MTVEYTVSRTGDSLDHAASLVGWQQEYDQLDASAFRGQLVDIRTDSVRLFRERATCKTLQRMHLPSGYRHLVLPLTWPGEAPNEAPLHLLPRGQRYRVVVPGGFDVLCLSVPEGIASGLPVHSREMTCRPHKNRQRLAAVKTRWSRLTDEVSHRDSRRSDAWIADQLEAGATCLLELLEQESAWRMPGNGSRQYIVERCHDLVQSRPASPPDIDAVCAAIRISRRTLQYSFTSQTGMTPTSYLRTIRLNAARRAIVSHPHTPVLDLAAEHGFLHASHFARVYRKLFGERPSDTRRRSVARQNGCPA